MSVICLQYGQCGNQVGEKLYSLVSNDLTCNSKLSMDHAYNLGQLNKWFSLTGKGKWEPRSILIDTENKVTEFNKEKPYCFKHVVSKSCGGSANNWAFGYFERSTLLLNDVLDCVRIEAEQSDFLTHILNIYSSSGGTGSGVGSKIIEELREIYPNKAIVNAVILPYFKGEIVTQNYNTILTLAKLYSIADSTILFENDKLHYICNNLLNIKDVTFSYLNDIIAQQLLSLFQPVKDSTTVDMLFDLTAHSSYKFLHIKNAPHVLREHLKYEAARNWKSLIESLFKQSRYESQQQARAKIKIKTKCISNAIISSGTREPTAVDIMPFTDPKNYVSWLPRSVCCKSYHCSRKFNNLDSYLTVASNSNEVYVPINAVVEDAWNIFTYGAYLHHYEKYEVDKEYFLNTFQIMENILHAYKTL